MWGTAWRHATARTHLLAQERRVQAHGAEGLTRPDPLLRDRDLVTSFGSFLFFFPRTFFFHGLGVDIVEVRPDSYRAVGEARGGGRWQAFSTFAMAGADRRNLAKELSSLVELSNTRARFAKAGRTLQAAYELTSLDQELSSRVKAVEKRRATAPQDPEMTADQRTAARQAAKLKKQEEEARQREWEARYTTPVADCMSFRKTSTRLAAAKACLTNGASHIFCCLTDSDQEYLARQISLNTSAFAIKGTTIVVEGGNAGLMVCAYV